MLLALGYPLLLLLSISSVSGQQQNKETVERLREECRGHKDLAEHDMATVNAGASCVALKTLYVLERFLETKHPETNGDENQVDTRLLGASIRLVKDLFDISEEQGRDSAGTPRRKLKKMMLPLLMGIVLKVSTIIPILLGKLTLMGIMALFASKLSLAILGLLSLKKMWEGKQHHESEGFSGGMEDHHALLGGSGGGGSHRRRTIYVVRGRELGNAPIERPQDLAFRAHVPGKVNSAEKDNRIS